MRDVIHSCDRPCGNKTASGYCATTACINPQFSNIGTAQYGQGVQKRTITNGDKLRAMSDEELAEFLSVQMIAEVVHGWKSWLDWLKQEAKE